MSASMASEIPNPQTLLRRAWGINRPLALAGLLMGATLAVAVVGLIIDPRVITGQPAWGKPARFAISISVYSFTLLWLLAFVEGHYRLVRLVSRVTAVALIVEMALIAGAAAAGTTSHFNFSTPVSTAAWSTMAVFIVLTWVMNLVVIVLLLVQRIPHPEFAWGLRLGVIVSSVGMAVAFLMTVPTPQQLRVARTGGAIPIIGAHTVGPADGGAGLPITNWSTVGGDLRVPHFVGLHALQVLPLVGFLLMRFLPSWLGSGHRTVLMWTAGLTYLGLVVILTWQARRGQPVISPDAVTLAMLAALFAAAGAVVAGVIIRARAKRASDRRDYLT